MPNWLKEQYVYLPLGRSYVELRTWDKWQQAAAQDEKPKKQKYAIIIIIFIWKMSQARQ